VSRSQSYTQLYDKYETFIAAKDRIVFCGLHSDYSAYKAQYLTFLARNHRCTAKPIFEPLTKSEVVARNAQRKDERCATSKTCDLSLMILSAILQRVLSASVTVDKQLVSSIGKGILVLAAVAPTDTEKDVESLANKVLKLRLWDDEAGGRYGCHLVEVFMQ